MPPTRQTVLLGLLFLVTGVTAVLLAGVLGSVFFAVTVAYVFDAPALWLRRRGLSRAWASGVATLAAFLSVLAMVVPIGVILYLRRRQLIAILQALPDRFVVEYAGFAYVADTGELASIAIRELTRTALLLARETPALAAKATVFAFVVFALLLRRDRLRDVFLEPTPLAYRDVVMALHERVRSTLRALYLLQAVTALGTFVVAVPVFWLLGYNLPVTLAVLAGILQFIPVIGPSLVIVGLAAFELSIGATAKAITVLVVGLPIVAFLPDAILRPRMAQETAKLQPSLYFVGFTGGVFSLGPLGIIAGPLVVALLVEAFRLYAAEAAPSED